MKRKMHAVPDELNNRLSNAVTALKQVGRDYTISGANIEAIEQWLDRNKSDVSAGLKALTASFKTGSRAKHTKLQTN